MELPNHDGGYESCLALEFVTCARAMPSYHVLAPFFFFTYIVFLRSGNSGQMIQVLMRSAFNTLLLHISTIAQLCAQRSYSASS
jgi:hypothetical protein